MTGYHQQTLKSAINCTGVGLHTGQRINMTLEPAAPGSGIRFVRTDADDALIPAAWDRVADTRLCTLLANDEGVSVGTVEHLMAALAGCAIDNVLIRLDGPEVPVMDGSSAPFVFLIECAGVAPQAAPRRSIRVCRTVEVEDGDKRMTISPSPGFSVAFEIDFDSRAIGRQTGWYDLHNGGFKKEICRARTFGFERDVENLRAAGLARGGSLENVVVIGSDDAIMNSDGLRFDDEFLRHKVLDTVGDLYLAGAPLLAHVDGVRAGHAMNNKLLHALFADEANWAWSDAVPVPTRPSADLLAAEGLAAAG